MMKNLVILTVLVLVSCFISPVAAEIRNDVKVDVDSLVKQAIEMLAREDYAGALKIIERAEKACKSQKIKRFELVIGRRQAYTLGLIANFQEFLLFSKDGKFIQARPKIIAVESFAKKLAPSE